MPSIEEIDYCIEQMGYYVYLEGFSNPDIKPYHILEYYFWRHPQGDNDIVVVNSDNDGYTYYFDVDSFLKDTENLIWEEGILETFEMFEARQHLWRTQMPKYFEYKSKQEAEIHPKTILYIWWYENGVTCDSDVDFPDHVQFEIRVDGELEYSWNIDDVSYEEAKSWYMRMCDIHSFDDVIFQKMFP